MSANDSTGFDEPAESRALLGQRDRIPDPAAVDATAALALNSGSVSKRLEDILSKCQTDSEINREMWDDFEIHRRSADTYMNQYLDYLQQLHEERSEHGYEIDNSDDEAPPTDVAAREPDSNATGMTKTQWQLKISHDSLVRDLLAMHETLEFLKTRAAASTNKGAPPMLVLLASATAVLLAWILWENDYREEALGLVVADVACVACYLSICKWHKRDSIESRQGKVDALLRCLQKGEVDERNRADLCGMSLK